MRRASETVQVGGVTIPGGAMVQVVLGSANRDEALCPAAGTYDRRRVLAAPHVAFGYGIHFCVGAALARLEMRIALEQLAERLPSLRLAPGQRVPYDQNLLLRGPSELHVEWEA
jgi:cytochrome P450